MKVIGITGPTGAGKTTALNALVSLGGRIIDADAVYHTLTRTSQPMRQELEARFGPVLHPSGGSWTGKSWGGGLSGSPGPGRPQRHYPPVRGPGRGPAGGRGRGRRVPVVGLTPSAS